MQYRDWVLESRGEGAPKHRQLVDVGLRDDTRGVRGNIQQPVRATADSLQPVLPDLRGVQAMLQACAVPEPVTGALEAEAFHPWHVGRTLCGPGTAEFGADFGVQRAVIQLSRELSKGRNKPSSAERIIKNKIRIRIGKNVLDCDH